ncbi:MAG: hypothetical protein ACTSW4_03210 [Candidatus Ranarchaeia archaeon]
MAAEMALKNEFRDLLFIKDRVKSTIDESESLVKMIQSSAIDEGFSTLLKRLERVRSNLSLISNDLQYQPSPADGNKNLLIVLTLLDSIMMAEAKHSLQIIREIQKRVDSGSSEVTAQIETIQDKLTTIRSMMTEAKDLAKGTIDEDTVKNLKKKYSKYIDKINNAMEASVKGAIKDELKIYVPEKPSLWKRVLFFWRDYSPESELPELLEMLTEKAKRGEIAKSVSIPELKQWILTERPQWNIEDKKLRKTLKTLTKQGKIPGIRESPSGEEIVYLAL